MWWIDDRLRGTTVANRGRLIGVSVLSTADVDKPANARTVDHSCTDAGRIRFRSLHLSDAQRAANLELCVGSEPTFTETSELEQLKADIAALEAVVRNMRSERQ